MLEPSSAMSRIGPTLKKVLQAAMKPASTVSVAKWALGRSDRRRLDPSGLPVQHRANRAAAADVDWMKGMAGASAGWARTEYGEYYATSVA